MVPAGHGTHFVWLLFGNEPLGQATQASGLPASTFKDARKRLEDEGFIEKTENGNWCATQRTEACPTIAPPL